ncbi:hypothetical protein [Spiractinospora alimapuensis]|uniref:hypothetical protein n=1 Tax=Spiractinospora alimapuensis TaxID=2820884 RepID=UPI002ED00D0F
MKHSRRIVLAGWQEDVVTRHPGALVRGLIHSDGCRFTNPVRRRVAGEWKHYTYPRYMFSNTSADIIAILGHALDRLGIAWRLRWRTHTHPNHQPTGTLSVARRESVTRLDALVGPKR